MPKYLITGRQGSGKTTVIKLLQDRGYAAYNTDDLSGVTKLENKATGQQIDWPADGKVDWSQFAWNWQRLEIEKLLTSSETAFIGAIVSNQAEFYSLFDRVFVLTVSANTLRKRLNLHEHESHHAPGEIERILTNHEQKQDDLIRGKAEAISGEQSPDQIIDSILNLL